MCPLYKRLNAGGSNCFSYFVGRKAQENFLNLRANGTLADMLSLFGVGNAMQLQTPVSLQPQVLSLTPKSRVMLCGSCFAQEVGKRMEASLPSGQVMANPFGVLYNPLSIARFLKSLLHPTWPDASDLMFRAPDGLIHYWEASTLFAASTAAELSEKLEGQWVAAKKLLSAADLLVVTLGTDHAYFLREGNILVANCHKMPAAFFEERILDLHEMQETWVDLLYELHRFCPDLKVVFTLSPYRYTKYGMHENALTKARLLLLVDALCQPKSDVKQMQNPISPSAFGETGAGETNAGNLYFPAYEILLDELRDYRFYEPDMLHPSAQAVDYIWGLFKKWAFSAELLVYAQEKETLLRSFGHRSLHPDSPEAEVFQQKLKRRVEAFEGKWGVK